MPNRYGVVAVVIGVVAIAIGRVFGVVELFVIGTAFVVAPIVATILVRTRHPRVRAERWVHPLLLTAGEVGHVDIQVVHQGLLRSPTFELVDRIARDGVTGASSLARVRCSPLRPRATARMRYALPTTRRGRIGVGPLTLETRDPLGLAEQSTDVCGVQDVLVVPPAHLLPMPSLGRGALGRQLVDRARRLGPGEFHALRDYADGDELRTIHWKASARSETLKVRQYEVEGLRRCTVAFDVRGASYLDDDSFERAVVAAASLVHSAAHAGLTTRMISTAGWDLRGPDVGAVALGQLALVRPTASDASPPGRTASGTVQRRDPSEGLGLVVVVTGSATAASVVGGLHDPGSVAVVVTTDVGARGPFDVGARTEREFVDTWLRLTGRRAGRGAA